MLVSALSWLVILLVLVAAFGPVFWLMPNKRDKRVTALRADARREGIVVDIKPLVRLRMAPQDRVSAAGKVRDAARMLPRYAYPLDKPLQRTSGWRVLRATQTQAPGGYERPSIDVEAGWAFDPDLEFPPQQGWPESWELLQPRPQEVIDSIQAVELEGRSIAIYWSESTGEVATIAAALRAWGQQLVEFDRAAAVTDSDLDS